MTSLTASRIMLDNSTVAGAGRALYDILPDNSDCRSPAIPGLFSSL